MPNLLKKILKMVFPNFYPKIVEHFNKVERIDRFNNNIEKTVGWLIKQKYESIAEYKEIKSEINKHEFNLYSQNGEDGILLYIFSKIGATNRRFVEFGVNGKTDNTTNLILNFGWSGLLMEGDRNIAEMIKKNFKNKLGEKFSNIKGVQAFITKENINKLLSDNSAGNEIDLLSLDIDGNDYWIWKEITAINPRVVVMEYSGAFGPEKSLTIKYDPNFRVSRKNFFYQGASLAALTKLAHSKGYVLIGCESNGINAFFIRKDVAEGRFEEIPVKNAYFPHISRLSTSQQFESIKHLPFEHV
jgi:hypothetical protein